MSLNRADKVMYRKKIYAPILIVELYLWFTIILYAWGPWDWQTKYEVVFYLLLTLYNFALVFGYYLGTKKRINIQNSYGNFTYGKKLDSNYKVLRYLNISIYLFLIFTILNCIRVTGLSTVSLLTYFEEVVNGLNNPALQYYNKFSRSSTSLFGGSMLSYANVILAPFLWPVIPLSIYYFKDLKLLNKVLIVFAILLETSRWIAIGTNKGIFDIAIIIITVILMKSLLNEFWFKKKKNTWVTNGRVIVILLLPLSFFVSAINDRLSGSYINMIPNVGINPDSFLLKIIPKQLKVGFILLSGYITQGYYGLSLAIGEKFTPTFGIGNSMFLLENFKELFGIDIFSNTYQYKLASYGWHPFVNWHTFYLWIANDVSLFGVIMVMFILGYFYAYVWKDVIINNNPIAIVLMSIFSIMFAYMPANNQVLTYPTTFMAFWGVFFYWLIRKKIRLR